MIKDGRTLRNLFTISFCTNRYQKTKSRRYFFALKGPNFNGNAFAKQAIEAGAVYAIIDEAEYCYCRKNNFSDDVSNTLQELAKFHGSNLPFPLLLLRQ